MTLKQKGSCLTGTLADSPYPTTGPVPGTVSNNHITRPALIVWWNQNSARKVPLPAPRSATTSNRRQH